MTIRKSITVSTSYSGKISGAQFENTVPFFSVSEVTEREFADDMEAKKFAGDRLAELQALCNGLFEQEVIKARLAKIKADRKDFRFYGEYPSVTSILGYDSDFLVNEDELKQYAAQGTIIHAQAAHFISTGEWREPKDIDGIGAELFILKTGNLGLALDGWDFPAAVKKFGLTKMENGEKVISSAHRYGGLPDFTCIYEGKPTICDIKRTPEKVKNYMQMSAYEMARREAGLTACEQMMIVPINDKTAQGYSKVMVDTNISKYFDLFLHKRKEFFKVYAI